MSDGRAVCGNDRAEVKRLGQGLKPSRTRGDRYSH